MDLIAAISASNVVGGPDVVAAGQVLAELNDWRAIMYGLMVMCALLVAALLVVVFFASGQ